MSVSIPECYNSIIGLTRTDCECYGVIPDDAADSLSGLYIDELVGLSFIQSMTDCDNGNDLFQNMVKARDNAITSFQADTNALLLENFKMKRNPFKGGIGRAVSNNNVSLTTGNYLGVRMYCDNVKSGVLYIKSIGTLFKGVGVIDLMIYNNLGKLIGTYPLNTDTTLHVQNSVDIELPLHSDYNDHLEYFFIYQLGAIEPKINDLKCSCGSFKPVFNCKQPYYKYKHETVYGWADWLMAGGINSATLPDFTDCGCSTNNYMYGLTFNVELRCKIGEVLCQEQLDFEGNPLAAAMAIAIQNKTGEWLGNWILRSGNLNRFTLLNTEQLIDDVAKFKATYEQMIKYIVESADITQNDCLACKDVYEMAKRGIFA